MLDHSGAPFKKFASLRDEWALKNCYISPGIITVISPFVSVAFTLGKPCFFALFKSIFKLARMKWYMFEIHFHIELELVYFMY